ncbi:MAG: c-type cytochrome [Spongiibacteraceae bacterium]|jgi:cytochrome c553|nr:c-type cytochrome [Spongiibacteraceae bacterium]
MSRRRATLWRLLTASSWRTLGLQLTALALAAAAGALLFAWLGFAPIAASSGHWPVTSWLLHFAMRNSVELRAHAVSDPPDLQDPALVKRGAGHYATACVSCHGAPGQTPAVTTRRMTPPPPLLLSRIPAWRDRELFWIVRHGVKFTAMPAWPTSQRDDEVWAMVAFLRRLPALPASEWRALTQPPDARPPALQQLKEPVRTALTRCASCHGYDGIGRYDEFPRLAGQREAYLLATLHAYREGRRHSGFMQVAAAEPDSAILGELVAWYASRTGPVRNEHAAARDPSAVARGRELALAGAELDGIPACADCHGPAGHQRNERYPLLAGQPAGYLERQLELLATGRRGGTSYAHIMQTIARRLSPAQRSDVAAFYASLEFDAPG